MAPDTRNAPTTEIGAAEFSPGILAGWGNFVDIVESAPKLRWPASIAVFEEMLNDSQVSALRDAVTLPIRRRRWSIDPNGARDEVIAHIADDFGLGIHGEDATPRDVSEEAFSFDTHLFTALLGPFLGHYFFEQTVALEQDGLLHLDRLGPRPPRTIMQINVSPNGDLDFIRQKFAPSTKQHPIQVPEPIPAGFLIPYVWEQEAGNWVGRSMLRPLYKHFLRKDAALRGDAQRNGRNALGVPTIEAPQGATDPEMRRLAQIAQSFRGGDYAGVALPYGAKLRLVGVEGTLPDIIGSVRYDDEQMARRFLAMFIQLGQTHTGSRALGDTFIDFFALGMDAMADWFCRRTEVAFRRIVTWNWGEQERCPRLVSERDENPELAAGDLVAMVDSGIITVDSELEATIRKRGGLPPRDPNAPAPAPVAPAPPAGPQASHRHRAAPRAAAGDTPERATRAPRPSETHTDWTDLEDTWRSARDALVSAWVDVRNRHIDDLATQIQTAGQDLAALAALQATVSDADAEVVARRMRDIADYGALTAREEAAAQGHTLPVPDMTPVRSTLNARAAAVADLLGRGISEAAGRQALQRTGGSLAPAEVANEVADHLRGLSNAYLEEQLGGALTQGMNTGRRATMGGAPAGTVFEASELLDVNTCAPCSQRDGTQYATVVDAERDYPAGGFHLCEGGVRCRGTLVMILPESTPSVQ